MDSGGMSMQDDINMTRDHLSRAQDRIKELESKIEKMKTEVPVRLDRKASLKDKAYFYSTGRQFPDYDHPFKASMEETYTNHPLLGDKVEYRLDFLFGATFVCKPADLAEARIQAEKLIYEEIYGNITPIIRRLHRAVYEMNQEELLDLTKAIEAEVGMIDKHSSPLHSRSNL